LAETSFNEAGNGTPIPDSFAPAARLLTWCDRNRRWLFAAVLVLYAAAFTGRWRINPDSAIYMSLGRSMAEGLGYVYNGEHHTRYEPGLPVVIAASYRIFGEDNYAPILVFELACGLASILLTYRLMLRHAGRPTAVLVTLGFAICETCYRYGFQVVTDTPFVVAVMLYLLAYELLVAPRDASGVRNRARSLGWVMIPLATFFMTAFRPTALTFVGAVGIACAWQLYRGPNRGRHVLIGVLTLAAFLSFRFADPRRSTAGAEVKREQRLKTLLTEQRSYFIPRVARESLDFVEEVVPKAIFGTVFAPGLNTVISLAVIAAGISLFRIRPLWGAWCLGTFAQSMVWLPRERYLLPILPLVTYGLWRGVVGLAARGTPGRVAACVVGGAFVVLNVGYDVHYVFEQHRVGVSKSGAADAGEGATLEMAKHLAQVVGVGDIAFATDHDELSYFSRRQVEGTPWSSRWPPTRRELDEFFDRYRAWPGSIYVVLPDLKSETALKDTIDRIGMQPGPAIATVERPRDRKGKPEPPLALHKLVKAR
jgi:hypothetical protein